MTKKKMVIDVVDYVSAYKAFVEAMFGREIHYGEKTTPLGLTYLTELLDISAEQLVEGHAKY